MPLVPLASRGGARQVHPDIAAGDEAGGHREVVILEVGDAGGHLPGYGHREQPLHQALGFLVLRMRLAGDHELQRSGPVEQWERSFWLSQQQVEPLVGGDAAREPDRQGLGREPEGCRFGVLPRHGAAGQTIIDAALLDPAHHLAPQRLADCPQLGVGNRIDGIPRGSFGRPVWPLRTEVAIEELAHGRRHPAGHVHAVGHVPDRHLLQRPIGPQGRPHPTGYFSVSTRDAVRGAARVQAEHGDAERFVRIFGMDATQCEERFGGE